MNVIARALGSSLKISKTAALMCTVIAQLFLALLFIGSLIIIFVYPFENLTMYAAGLLAGCLLSFFKVVLLEKAIGKSMDMENKNAQLYAGLQAFVRYGLTLLAFLPALFGLAGVWGLIAGVLVLQIAAYITNYKLKDEKWKTL